MRRLPRLALTLFLFLAAAPATADDAFPIPTGTHLGHADLARLEPYLPTQYWAQRDVFFPPDMDMEIGPAFRDYSPPPVYQEATQKHAGAVSFGPDDTLAGYHSGQPFPRALPVYQC